MEPEHLVYCIRIGTHLDREWSEWFEAMVHDFEEIMMMPVWLMNLFLYITR